MIQNIGSTFMISLTRLLPEMRRPPYQVGQLPAKIAGIPAISQPRNNEHVNSSTENCRKHG